jgi:hypothetical protein
MVGDETVGRVGCCIELAEGLPQIAAGKPRARRQAIELLGMTSGEGERWTPG